jgi:hypothetical protein
MRKCIQPFPAILLLALIILSCKKNASFKDETRLSAEASDARFLNTSLKQFAIDLAPVLSNASTRNSIRNFAKQKFDEEYEVLIKDIFEDPRIASLVPVSKSGKLHNDIFKRSGEHLYPQIYIPHLQYIEDQMPGNSREQLATPDSILELPVYVFYSGDAEVDSALDEDIYPGYLLLHGSFVFSTMVDEAYANEHEVWVFSLNETVNDAGKYVLPCEVGTDCGDGGTGGGGGGGTGGGGGGGGGVVTLGPDDDPTDAPMERKPFPELNHNKINFKIQNMRVAVHKESWLSGASEVSIRAKLVCHNGRALGDPLGEQYEYTSDQYSGYRGKLIKKVKRKDIRNVELLTVNYPMQTEWQNEWPSQDPVHFIYIIFERDNWPAQVNNDFRYALPSLITGEQPPGGFYLSYRSGGEKKQRNYPYARYHFTNTLWLSPSYTYAGSGLVENSEMAFNTVLY